MVKLDSKGNYRNEITLLGIYPQNSFWWSKKSVFQILNSKTLIFKTMVYINGYD